MAQQIECSELPCEIRMTEMRLLAQRAEQTVRGAGHADHPRASMLMSAMFSMVVNALHQQFGGGASRRSRVEGFCGAKVLRM